MRAWLVALALLLAGCSERAPRFQPGDTVELKGFGSRGIVVRVACDRLRCMHQLRTPSLTKVWVPEELLERVVLQCRPHSWQPNQVVCE